MKRVITFGTFDLLHQGHLNILKRSKNYGDYLIVGISSDQLNDIKGKRSYFPQEQRMAYVADLEYVDEVFLEVSLELKDEYVKQYEADILVMGDDWAGKFDWVSCEVAYLPRTQGISSTMIKTEIEHMSKCGKALFGDTYIDKHMDCALTIVNDMTSRNVAPIFTKENALPRHIGVDALFYFNKPINPPFPEYDDKSRVLIDHGASHLKWFLGSRQRFNFFDIILTAGPDHMRSLKAIFEDNTKLEKVRACGFIKSKELLSEPQMTRKEVCALANLDHTKPIVLFVPTWHITANDDIITTIQEMQRVENHIASFHPETRHLPTDHLNVVNNVNGITTELLKHADVVVSDLSSTIYEAAALRKPVVQILMKEYPDNMATLFDFPLSAGTAEHFCGGLACKPHEIVEAIAKVMSADASILAMVDACQDRILSGTFITKDATEMIADQIKLICDNERKVPIEDVEVEVEKPKTPLHQRNLFFAYNRMIAHGGGNFDGHHCSNSREAMEAGLAAVNIVEMDFSMGKDGIIAAHDAFEPRYGLEASFVDTPVSTFLKTKYEEKLTPVSVEEIIRSCTRTGKALVCDIKPTKEAYKTIAQSLYELVREHGQIEQTVIQCYSVEDFVEAMRLGFKRVMLPVWKYFYRNPIGPEIFDFYSRCIEINADAVWGLSLPYINKHMSDPIIDHPDFVRLFAYWKRIFIHAAPPEEYSRILKMNVGLFADSIDREYEFKDVPKGFDWRKYLFLNRQLMNIGRTTEVQSIRHYLKYGQHEQRHVRYDIPQGFNYADYINANPNLRKFSINAINSAAAHFTHTNAVKKTDK